MDYNLLIGGAAGQGMETLTNLLERMLKRQGFSVFTTHDYMSRVRGGHNFMRIRFGDHPLHAHRIALDGMIALNAETIELHEAELSPDGFILADVSVAGDRKNATSLPLLELATTAGNPKTAGTVALGAVLGLFGLSLDGMGDVIKRQFPKADITEVNEKALRAGYEAVAAAFAPPGRMAAETHLLNGNQAIAIGALAAGCRFYSAYPMTPSTSVMDFLADKMAATGILVEQAEDEIAAIQHGHRRLLCRSAGHDRHFGGRFLPDDGSGRTRRHYGNSAGCPECDAARCGPRTGLPTRTEQADLQFVIYAAQGEYPRMVVSVRNPSDAYRQTMRAFQLADRYQMPVILLSDQYLADARQTIPPLVVEPEDGPAFLSDAVNMEPFSYRRYALTESGISPRLVPGRTPGQIIKSDSDEHDEGGYITESASVRNAMVEKRARKMELLKTELEEPALYGNPDADILLLAWGSMEGPVLEALSLLKQDGIEAKALVFGDIWPLPVKLVTEQAAKARHILNVEQNSTGQLALLVREATEHRCHRQHSSLRRQTDSAV